MSDVEILIQSSKPSEAELNSTIERQKRILTRTIQKKELLKNVIKLLDKFKLRRGRGLSAKDMGDLFLAPEDVLSDFGFIRWRWEKRIISNSSCWLKIAHVVVK